MTHLHTRTLTGLATALLLALPLAACDSGTTEDPTTATTTPEAPTTTEEATPDPADATPQERIEAYFAASDANAAEGWPDSSYADEYLVPEVAELQKESDAENAETGAIITGDRELSDWTTIEETDTSVTIEFCDDISDHKATKDGEPYELSNPSTVNVGQFVLTREDADSPWMIQTKGYYEAGTSCDDHFAD